MSKSKKSSSAGELNNLLEDAESALSRVAGQAGGKIDQLRARVRDAVERSRDTLGEVRESARQRLQEGDVLVRENPYYAIGVAAGIGALVGLLISRSCKGSR